MDASLSDDLITIKQIFRSKLNVELENIKVEKESATYSACTFNITKLLVLYREAKVTPTKIGSFVTIWKRNADGATEPFNINDDIDLIVISCRKGEQFGQFVFPKNILGEKKVLTKKNIEGKRGIRVYPPWDIAINKQAMLTQAWQSKYFLDMRTPLYIDTAKKLFGII